MDRILSQPRHKWGRWIASAPSRALTYSLTLGYRPRAYAEQETLLSVGQRSPLEIQPFSVDVNNEQTREPEFPECRWFPTDSLSVRHGFGCQFIRDTTNFIVFFPDIDQARQRIHWPLKIQLFFDDINNEWNPSEWTGIHLFLSGLLALNQVVSRCSDGRLHCRLSYRVLPDYTEFKRVLPSHFADWTEGVHVQEAPRRLLIGVQRCCAVGGPARPLPLPPPPSPSAARRCRIACVDLVLRVFHGPRRPRASCGRPERVVVQLGTENN